MSTSDSEIIDLIPKARLGDDAACGRLLDLHRDYLRNIAAQQIPATLQGRIDDSDVVQQTCLSVHKQFGGFTGSAPAEFVAWLRQIHERNIRNVIRDLIVVQKRSVGRDVHLEHCDGSESESTPSQIVSREEEAARMMDAVGALPEEAQHLVRLRYYENRTVPQIAEYLGLTEDGVMWRLRKAMKTLKRQLGDRAN